MNRMTMIPALIGLGVASLGLLAFTQGEQAEFSKGYRQEGHGTQDKEKARNKSDADKLYELVRQARADLEALRVHAGIPRGGGGDRREGRGEHREGRREGRGEHGEGRREGRGEHGEGGEEGGTRIRKNENWDETRKGARLVLAYDAATQSFRGTVQNTTSRTLSEVRVEVHLSNGVELGPTKRTDLKPGAKIRVELSAANQRFSWWTTHPEAGNEEGHGPGHEEGGREGRGEHGGRGEGAGNRPQDGSLRPVYNQLMLLRTEIRRISKSLQRRRR